MLSFTAYQRTEKTAEDVLATFVGAVDPESQPSREKSGIEGAVHWGEMRWREREFDPVDGVSYGPDICAKAAREGDGVVIRGFVRPSMTYWLVPVLGAAGFVAAFAIARTRGMLFGLPDELSWLFVAAAVWFFIRAFTDLRSHLKRAEAFASGLLKEAPNQSPEPTSGLAPGRGSS